jgi:hypothetical protein
VNPEIALMHGSWPNSYQHWPTYLAFPSEIPRSKLPVPNRQSVDWPQSQFAPPYLPPGSASFQPYRYGPNGPLSNFRPVYRVQGLQTYGGVNMAFARFNTGELPSTDVVSGDVAQVVDMLLETPVSVPTESIVPAAAVEAAEDGEPASFVPFEDELLVGLPDKTTRKLRRLEVVLTKLENASSLGPLAQVLQTKLLRTHERMQGKLEDRLERKAKREGQGGNKVRKGMRLLRARRAVQKARQPLIASEKVSKAHRLNQIRTHYQSGQITKAEATMMAKAVMQGKQAILRKEMPSRHDVAAVKTRNRLAKARALAKSS